MIYGESMFFNAVYTVKQMLFKSISCNGDHHEITDSTEVPCGFSYENEDRDLIKPKLKTKSRRYAKVVRL